MVGVFIAADVFKWGSVPLITEPGLPSVAGEVRVSRFRGRYEVYKNTRILK